MKNQSLPSTVQEMNPPHVTVPQNGREVLRVDNVLPLCHHDPPSPLEQGFVVFSFGVGGSNLEESGHAVVLPEEERVEAGEA